MAVCTAEQLSSRPGYDEIARMECLRQYRALGRAVIRLAWQDGHMRSRVSPAVTADARAFLFSDAAKVWAEIPSVDRSFLRHKLEDEASEEDAASPHADDVVARGDQTVHARSTADQHTRDA